MKAKGIIVYPTIILAMIFWSLSFVWYKMVYEYYEPITTIFLRLILSSVFLIPFTYFLKKLQKIERQDYKYILLLSFFQPFLYFVGESIGVKFVSSTTAAVIISTIPVLTPIVAFLVFREKLSVFNVLGVLLSFFGVLMVILEKDLSFVASPIGLMLMLLAVASAIVYSVLIIKLAHKYNAYTITTVQNFIGIFLFLPLFLIFDYQKFIQVEITMDLVIPLLELSIFASSFAFIFFTYGIKELGISKANMFTNIIPVFTAIFAYFLLDELLNMQKITGILIVLAGLFMSQLSISGMSKVKTFVYKRFNYRT
jgi:drug/metabolite transporter (DMT)-like permease